MIQEVKYQNQYENDSRSSYEEQRTNQTFNEGNWLKEELLKFMLFAQYNLKVFTSRLLRRTNKIFKQMAKFIETRSPTQCRSQNQKLFKKHKNIKKIIKVYETQIGEIEFQRAYLYYYNRLREMQSARKKFKLMRSLQLVSVCAQTDFLSESSSQEFREVKVEQEQERMQADLKMQFTHIPIFPLYGQTLLEKQH